MNLEFTDIKLLFGIFGYTALSDWINKQVQAALTKVAICKGPVFSTNEHITHAHNG